MKRSVLVLILTLSGCTTIAKVNETLDDASRTLKSAGETLAQGAASLREARAEFRKAKKAADKNGDGTTSLGEWIAYLIATAGAAGGALLARNAKSNARKTMLEEKVARLEKTAKP